MESLLDFLAGAATLGYLVVSGFFYRFWRRTHERLFLAFGVAFALLALNQAAATYFEAGDERTLVAYALRVIGFLLILAAIVDKNVSSKD
ncbi:MAG: DUF5985 family protein [Clostridia bacterium]